MKMNVRKVFSIIIASLAVYLFINMFINYVGITDDVCSDSSEKMTCALEVVSYANVSSIPSGSTSVANNMWGISIAVSVFMVIAIVATVTIHILYIVGVLKEKWVNLVNFLVGFISLYHLTFLFDGFAHIEVTRAGLWLGTVVSLAMLVLSVLWYFMSSKAFGENRPRVTGYDAKTGQPVYAKQRGFDPQTGKPIY